MTNENVKSVSETYGVPCEDAKVMIETFNQKKKEEKEAAKKKKAEEEAAKKKKVKDEAAKKKKAEEEAAKTTSAKKTSKK